MNLSKFDPWSVVDCSDARAYRAYRAYSASSLGTTGTIGARGCASLDDFEERSAVIEIGSSLDRVAARKQAAEEFGFSSVSDLHATTIQMWRERLERAKVARGKDNSLLQAAVALCNGPWVARLAALGWDEVSLFSVSLERLSTTSLIQALNKGQIIAATASAIYFSSKHGRLQTYGRFSASDEDYCLVWDM